MLIWYIPNAQDLTGVDADHNSTHDSVAGEELRATARRNVLKKLDTFPPGLKALYERMMQQISVSDDATLCKQVLASAALVYRPITLQELVALTKPLEDLQL